MNTGTNTLTTNKGFTEWREKTALPVGEVAQERCGMQRITHLASLSIGGGAGIFKTQSHKKAEELGWIDGLKLIVFMAKM